MSISISLPNNNSVAVIDGGFYFALESLAFLQSHLRKYTNSAENGSARAQPQSSEMDTSDDIQAQDLQTDASRSWSKYNNIVLQTLRNSLFCERIFSILRKEVS